MHTISSNTAHSRTSSAHGSTALRPRVRRVISGHDQHDEDAYHSHNTSIAPSTRRASPLPSPYDSRATSPIPRGHLSRPVPPGNDRGKADESGRSDVASLSSLWGSSWTTLQGIASDLLGSDLAPAAATARGGDPKRRRKLSYDRNRRAERSVPKTWGPSSSVPPPAPSFIGTESREQREAQVRARKRQDLLVSGVDGLLDPLYKRRTSDDHLSISAPPAEDQNRDALVYVHHVTPSDTLAGITIRYNCRADVVRKANRMWPNDRVQVRKTIVLPVDACGVKGTPCSGPVAQKEDQLTADQEPPSAGLEAADRTPTQAYTPKFSTGAEPSQPRDRKDSSSTSVSRPSNVSSTEMEPPWRHESWVVFPGAAEPTEIARLSRRNLGYFPPARRKSISYSDLGTPNLSLDLPRTSLSSNGGLPQRPRRPRRLSNANNGYFPSYLAGPGGVGTMKPNVRYPGPAQDGLNKLFASRLPDVAPPRNQQQLYLPDLPLYSDESTGLTPNASGATTPNLQNVGATVEGWIRNLASKTSKALDAAKAPERSQAARASVGVPGPGGNGIGDLIELAEGFEIGGDDENEDEEEEERGRRGSAMASCAEGSGTSYGRSGAYARRRGSGSGLTTGQCKED
ncbi:hypothetical protein LTR66_007700 [Elasticomyces elasticus]|nr:hypothetical protein LTR66_007700 [Elasticomyces elasticus]